MFMLSLLCKVFMTILLDLSIDTYPLTLHLARDDLWFAHLLDESGHLTETEESCSVVVNMVHAEDRKRLHRILPHLTESQKWLGIYIALQERSWDIVRLMTGSWDPIIALG